VRSLSMFTSTRVICLRFAVALRRGLENLPSSGRQKGRYLEFHNGMKTSLKKFSVNG
jgi:hypothetical protein